MSDKPAHLPALLRSDDAPERRERMYLFVVTTVAVFLVVVLATVRPQPKLPVEAVLLRPAQTPQGNATQFPTVSATALVEDRQLCDAIADGKGISVGRVSVRLVDHYRQHLHLHQPTALDGQQRKLIVRYEGGLPEGHAVVNALIEGYMDQHSVQIDAAARDRYAQAASSLQAATAQAEAARDAVDQFLKRHFDTLQLGAALEAEKPDAEAAPTTPAKAPAPPMVSAPQPRLAALQQQLSAMQQQMDRLLLKLHAQHPVARSLKAEIDAIQEQIAALRATQVAEAPAPAEQPRDAAKRAEERARQLERYHVEKQRYEQLLAAQRDAAKQLEKAHADAAAAQATLQSVAETAITVERWAQPPRENRGAGLAMAAFALVLAMACGGVAARGIPRDPTFRNRAHAERVLDVPVIGAMPDPTVMFDPARAQLPPAVMLVRRASEIALLVVLLFLIVLVVSDIRFAVQLATDPLGAIAAAGAKLAAWFAPLPQ